MGRQTAGLNPTKNRWLGRGCENCCQLPGKGLRDGFKRLKRLRAGKRQARRSLKTWLGRGCKNCCQLPGREGLQRLKGLTAGNGQARTP